MTPEAPDFLIEVLEADLRPIAGFASEIEAYRYAALISGPQLAPVFRRRADGAVVKFEEVSNPEHLATWVRPKPAHEDRQLSSARPPT